MVAGQSKFARIRAAEIQMLDRRRRSLLVYLGCTSFAQQMSHFDVLRPGMYQTAPKQPTRDDPISGEVIDLCVAPDIIKRFHVIRQPDVLLWMVVDDEYPDELSGDLFDLIWASGGRCGDSRTDVIEVLLMQHGFAPPWVRGIEDGRRVRATIHRARRRFWEMFAHKDDLDSWWCDGCGSNDEGHRHRRVE